MVATLAVCAVLATGACGTHDNHESAPPSAADSQAPASTATPASGGQAAVFFPGTVDTFGLTAGQADRDHLAELAALRRIDPCGFVNPNTLSANSRADASYAPSAARAVVATGLSPIAPLGGDACTVAFPGTTTGLELRILPGEPRWNDAQFAPDPSDPAVLKMSAPACGYRVEIPLNELAGAPGSMRNPVVEISPVDISGGSTEVDAAPVCQVASALATNAASTVGHNGIPVRGSGTSTGADMLTLDPCRAAPQLHAEGFIWKEPSAAAQMPTTWRHPGVCNLSLSANTGELASSSAVVKIGLVAWSDNVLAVPWGERPKSNKRDGVELFDYSDKYLGAGCLVVAKPDATIAPNVVGTAAPALTAPSPVATVRISAPEGSNCVDTAEKAALAVLNRSS